MHLSVYRVHCVVLKSNLFVSAGNPNFHVNLPWSHNGVFTLEDTETNNETDNYTEKVTMDVNNYTVFGGK